MSLTDKDSHGSSREILTVIQGETSLISILDICLVTWYLAQMQDLLHQDKYESKDLFGCRDAMTEIYSMNLKSCH